MTRVSIVERLAVRRPGNAILLVLGVALLVRLALVAATRDYRLMWDSLDFDRVAISIADGHGYPASHIAAAGGPSAFRPPGFSYLLGGVYAVTDHSLTAARLANVLVGVAAAALTYLIAARLWDPRTALVAGLIVAVFPPLIVLNVAVLSDTLFITLELAAVLAILELRRGNKPLLWAAGAGVLLGAAALTRSNGLFLILPAIWGAWYLRPWRSWRAAAAPALLAATAVLTIAPWTIRNAFAFDDFVPTTTQLGFAIATTYTEESRTADTFRGTWSFTRFIAVYGDLLARRDLNENELNETMTNRATSYARSHPGYVLEAAAMNTLRAFGVIQDQFRSAFRNTSGDALGDRTIDLELVSVWALGLLAIAGGIVLTRAGPPRWGPAFVWAFPLITFFSSVPVNGDPRYRTPSDPFLAMLAAVALVAGLAWIRSRTAADDQAVGVTR